MDERNNNLEKIDLSNVMDDTGEKITEELQKPEQIFSPRTPKMVKVLIKFSGGLIKTEIQSMCILLAISVIVIIISWYFIIVQLTSRASSLSPEPINTINQDGALIPR
jgi:hypothetical protein